MVVDRGLLCLLKRASWSLLSGHSPKSKTGVSPLYPNQPRQRQGQKSELSGSGGKWLEQADIGGEAVGRMGVHFLMASDRLREHPSEAGVARRGTRLPPPNWTPAELQSLAGPPQGCPQHRGRSVQRPAGPPRSMGETCTWRVVLLIMTGRGRLQGVLCSPFGRARTFPLGHTEGMLSRLHHPDSLRRHGL